MQLFKDNNHNDKENAYVEFTFDASADMDVELLLRVSLMPSVTSTYSLLDLYDVYVKPIDGAYEQITENTTGESYSNVVNQSIIGTGAYKEQLVKLCTLNLSSGSYTLKIIGKSTKYTNAATLASLTFSGITGELALS